MQVHFSHYIAKHGTIFKDICFKQGTQGTESFLVFFSEYINYEFSARNYCVLPQENLEEFSERCSLISGVLQDLAKTFKKYMEVNYFLLLSCSLEKQLLVE